MQSHLGEVGSCHVLPGCALRYRGDGVASGQGWNACDEDGWKATLARTYRRAIRSCEDRTLGRERLPLHSLRGGGGTVSLTQRKSTRRQIGEDAADPRAPSGGAEVRGATEEEPPDSPSRDTTRREPGGPALSFLRLIFGLGLGFHFPPSCLSYIFPSTRVVWFLFCFFFQSRSVFSHLPKPYLVIVNNFRKHKYRKDENKHL